MATVYGATQLPFFHPARVVATWFWIGHFPLAPGTLASLAALPVAWAVLTYGGEYRQGILFLLALLAFVVGIWAGGAYGRRNRKDDPKEVVIDEVMGQWLTLVFALPDHIWHLAAGFLVFRFFDILKPWPANWADRNIKGGFGIMMDDLVAAIYSAAVMYVIAHFSETTDVFRIIDQYVDGLISRL
jgi:phosphatidylglycerophosphatase A